MNTSLTLMSEGNTPTTINLPESGIAPLTEKTLQEIVRYNDPMDGNMPRIDILEVKLPDWVKNESDVVNMGARSVQSSVQQGQSKTASHPYKEEMLLDTGNAPDGALDALNLTPSFAFECPEGTVFPGPKAGDIALSCDYSVHFFGKPGTWTADDETGTYKEPCGYVYYIVYYKF